MDAKKGILCEVIADKYGYEAQSRQAIEEMAELTQAINKLWRKELDLGQLAMEPTAELAASENYLHIAEEIADVEICLSQLKYLLDCGMLVDHFKQEKIDRQIKRMEDKKWM